MITTRTDLLKRTSYENKNNFLSDYYCTSHRLLNKAQSLDSYQQQKNFELLAGTKPRPAILFCCLPVNGLSEKQTIAAKLAFLTDLNYKATIIMDGKDPQSYTTKEIDVNRTDSLTVDMAGRGGFVACISQQNNKNE